MTIPPAVRVLPMDERVFSGRSIAKLQDTFFRKDLPFREDSFYCHFTYGLDAPAGSIVLFQYKRAIVASAVFTGRHRYPKPDKEGYAGELYFEPKSIRTFGPVDSDTIRQIWPSFKRFSHVKLNLAPKRYPQFVSQLSNVKRPKT